MPELFLVDQIPTAPIFRVRTSTPQLITELEAGTYKVYDTSTPVSGTVTAGGPPMYDDFAGMAVGASLTGRVAPSGQAWSLAAGSGPALVMGNYSGLETPDNTTQGVHFTSYTPSGADCWAELDQIMVGTTFSTQNYWPVLRSNEAATDFYTAVVAASSGLARIARVTGSTTTYIATSATALVAGDYPLSLRFEAEGNALRLLNAATGALLVSGTDSGITAAGRVGLRYVAGGESPLSTRGRRVSAFRAGVL